MANLSAPTVGEPLYECAGSVVVTGYVPGAKVTISAEPPAGPAVVIGGGVSSSASGQVFGVAVANMVAGAKVTAVQAYMGDTSPPSPEAAVQAALSLDAPLLTAPLLECARCVRVSGLLPGVKAEILDAGATVGQSSAAGASAHVPVNPPLAANHTIKARQVYCGQPGPDSPGMASTASNPRTLSLAAPEVAEPLFACQQSCVVKGCMPGCELEVFVNGQPTASTCTVGTAVAVGIAGGLVQNTSITARQSLCGGTLQSGMSAAAVVQPAANIPKPAIWPPLYEGDTTVLIGMTVAGEIVTITADGKQVGMGGAGGGNNLLNVDPPLVAGQEVVATVELCSVKKSSLPVLVLPAPKMVPPPQVVKPLIACSLFVKVADCIPGAEVRVFAESMGKSVLLGVAKKTLTTTAAVPVTPPLKQGWSVRATQKVGAITSGPSAPPVTVDPPPATIPVPTLTLPILECARCVHVGGLVVGARVDVYKNGVWVGGADADVEAMGVEVYPGLSLKSTITVTQTFCSKVSKPAKGTVTSGSEKVPAPSLQPAFANKTHVTVTDAVPGAIVEVEETSVYKQVIGKACAAAKTAAVGLGIPLFAGAVLRARQKLCSASPYSSSITVGQPEEWPLGPGPFKAGFRLVADVPVSPDVSFQDHSVLCNGGGQVDFFRPATNKAVIFYPATVDGQDTAVAAGGPFPILVFAHGRRQPLCSLAWEPCPGAPSDTGDDFRQLSGILSHLARWGFVSIAADLSWLADTFGIDSWTLVLSDAATYIVAEHTRAGSPLEGKLQIAAISLLGHSTGGFAAIELATSGLLSVDALGLLAPAGGADSVVKFAPKPILVVHGTQDTGSFGDGGQSVNVYAAAGPAKHIVTIDGANHFGFTDGLCILKDPPATIGQADQQKIAKAYLTAFFRRYVQDAVEVEDYLTGARPVEELDAFTVTVQSQT